MEVLIMVCLFAGIAGGVGLKHFLEHRHGGAEILPQPGITPDGPASGTNGVSTTTNSTAMMR